VTLINNIYYSNEKDFYHNTEHFKVNMLISHGNYVTCKSS